MLREATESTRKAELTGSSNSSCRGGEASLWSNITWLHERSLVGRLNHGRGQLTRICEPLLEKG